MVNTIIRDTETIFEDITAEEEEQDDYDGGTGFLTVPFYATSLESSEAFRCYL